MPVKVMECHGKFRVVEAASGLVAVTPQGSARDGGGHATRAAAEAQARAINASIGDRS